MNQELEQREYVIGSFGFIEILSTRDVPRVYMVLRGDMPFSGYWSLPGGAVRKGESLDDACKREVWEEIGLRVTPSDDLGFVRFLGNDGKKYEANCFQCHPDSKNKRLDIKKRMPFNRTPYKEVLEVKKIPYFSLKAPEYNSHKIAPPVWRLLEKINSGENPPYEIPLI